MNDDTSPILGAVENDSIADTERMGELVMAPMQIEMAVSILNNLRNKLRDGFLIFAHDLDAPILEPIRSDIGGEEAWASGLIMTPMKGRPRKLTQADFNLPSK